MLTGLTGRKGLWGEGVNIEHTEVTPYMLMGPNGGKGLRGKVIRIKHLADRE